MTPARIPVDLAALFICKCGFALEPTNIAGVAWHRDRLIAGVDVKGAPIECEFSGKYFKIPWATLEEYRHGSDEQGGENIMQSTIKGGGAELPRYKCHKEVRALKIRFIEFQDDGRATITPEESRYAPFEVDADFTRRHDLVSGGYFVVYEDGYQSFSPTAAFEEGYTRI